MTRESFGYEGFVNFSNLPVELASEVWKKGHEATTTDDWRNAMSSELYPSHGWKDRNGDKSVACRRPLILR
jgi:hypothetical protein